MAKDQYDITSFTGGINTKIDARNIGDDESTDMLNVEASTNFAVDRKGKLRLSGALNDRLPGNLIVFGPDNFIADDSFSALEDIIFAQIKANKGNGLYIFSHDYRLVRNPGISENLTYGDAEIVLADTTLVCFYDRYSIRIWDSSIGGITDSNILAFEELEDDQYIIPEYTYFNGVLYIVDSNFDNESVGKKLYLRNDTFFEKTNNPIKIHAWVVMPMSAPNGRLLSSTYFSDTPLVFSQQPFGENIISLDFLSNPTGESMSNSILIEDAIYRFGVNYKLENNTWTEIYNLDTVFDMSTLSQEPKIAIKFLYDTVPINFDFGITGASIWVTDESTGAEAQLMQLDFLQGTWSSTCTGDEQTGQAWSQGELVFDDTNGQYYAQEKVGGSYRWPVWHSPPFITFKAIAGFEQDKASTANYKTSAIVGQTLYAGNIKQDGVVYSDRVLKSPPLNPTVLSEEDIIMTATDDGEEIVKLNSYADRLLQFKNNTLYIINCAQKFEFIEEKYPNYGISFKSASCELPQGVAFANKNGAYLYTGKEVMDLLAPQGLRVISKREWEDFTFTDDKNGDGSGVEYEKHLIIGYEPIKNKLHLYNDYGAGYSFSMFNGAISKTQGRYANHQSALDLGMSNIVTHNGIMYAACLNGDEYFDSNNDSLEDETGSGGLFRYNTKPQSIGASTDTLLKTKDIDFNTPGIRKKVYRVYITYRIDSSTSQAPNIRLSGNYTNNSGTQQVSFKGEQNADANGNLANADENWLKAILVPTTSLNSIYSLQLKLTGLASGDVPEGFEIDDISITYRLKGVR